MKKSKAKKPPSSRAGKRYCKAVMLADLLMQLRSMHSTILAKLPTLAGVSDHTVDQAREELMTEFTRRTVCLRGKLFGGL